ncbi:MAG TPA: EamA family transporter [Ramlibacter sp.]|nr:EamA family transporter [Ramlibacter sp.]
MLRYLVPTGVLLAFGMPLARWLAPQGVEPLAFAFWPTAAAGLALALLAAARGQGVLRADVLRFGALAGLGGYALPMTGAFWLATMAGAAFASLAFTLPPLFTLALNLLLGRERWRWWRVGAIGVGLAGALLLVLRGPAQGPASAWPLVLVLAVPALIGGTNVYRSIHLPRGVAPAWLGALTLTAAAAMLLLAGLARDALDVPLQPAVLAGLAAQALALVAGYLCYFELQRRADAVSFSFLGYVTMLTGVAIGALVLGEQLAWTTLPAALLILLALWMVTR